MCSSASQLLSLIYSGTQYPNVDSKEMTALLNVFDLQGMPAHALGCTLGWSSFARTVYYGLLPLTSAGYVGLLSTVIVLLRARPVGMHELKRALQVPPGDDRGAPSVAPEGIDSCGQQPCDLCRATFAKWRCVDEGVVLCARCDAYEHPKGNRGRREHRRVPIISVIPADLLAPMRTVVLVRPRPPAPAPITPAMCVWRLFLEGGGRTP